jgi:hypothetical protein
MTEITAVEYFFDSDPGTGNGTALMVTTPGNIITQNLSLSVPPGLSPGQHLVSIRGKDTQGRWSIFETDTITVIASPVITCPSNVTVTAVEGQCSAVVNGIDPVVSPQGTAIDYSLSGATTGNGNGSASGLNFNPGVTTVTYTIRDVPGISCSFTVTVNPNVVPSVTISSSAVFICASDPVTFTASPVNGGTPSYQWKINGVSVPAYGQTFQSADLANNDTVTVEMTSSISCANPLTVTSNSIIIVVQSRTTVYRDLDNDGYGNPASGILAACVLPAGYSIYATDCLDTNPSVYPGADEVCGNSLDDDCDGQVDENCAWEHPVLILRTYPVREGNSGFTQLAAEITLDRVAPSPVQVTYTTMNGDATAGVDYLATSGTLTIPAGSQSDTLLFNIIGDVTPESVETFYIRFSDPVNVLLFEDSTSRVKIIEDDRGVLSRSADPEVSVEAPIKIPTLVKRGQAWNIPGIGMYANKIWIMNIQGQVVKQFVNSGNQVPIHELPAGMHFYRVELAGKNGKPEYYQGKLMILD